MRDDIVAFLKAIGIKEPTETQIQFTELMMRAQRGEITIALNRPQRHGKSRLVEAMRKARDAYAVTNQKP